MADLKKTIDIVLNGEDRASKHIRAVNESMGNLGPKFASVAKTGVAAAAAVTAVAAAVIALVGAGLKEAYDQAVRFESAMVELEKVLGSQPEALDQAKIAAMELSNQYGVSSSEIVESIAGWVQAGYDIQDATQLAEESIALLYTSELNAAEATTTLTKIMKGFGLEVDEARGKLDVANEISNNYASSVGQLTEAMGRVAPIASAMGLSFEEMASFLVPAIEKFQDGERVGTAFAKILNNLVSDTSRVEKGLAALGVSQTDANGSLRSGRDILFDVAKAFQDIEPNQKTFVAQQLAGAEHSAEFLATMNSFDKVGAVYDTAMNSSGSVTEELVAQLEAAEKQLDRWDTAWENLSVTVGDQFKGAATEAVKGGTAIVNAIKDSIGDGDLDSLFDELESTLADVGVYLEDIADALPEALEGVNWDGVATSMRDMGDAIVNLFGDFDLTDPEELQQAIQGVVDGFTTLTDFSATMVNLLDPFLSFIGFLLDGFNHFYDRSTEIWNRLQGTIGLAVAGVLELVEDLYNVLSTVPGIDLSGYVDGLRDMKDAIHENVAESFDDAAEAAKRVKDRIDTIPDEKSTNVDVSDDGTIQETQDKIKEVPKDLDVEVKTSDDEVDKTNEKIEGLLEVKKLKIEVDADLKMAKVDAEIERFKAIAETAQNAAEWDAKLDIAQAEAEAEKLKTVFNSVNTSIESTATSIGDAMSAFSQDMSTTEEWAVERYFRDEADRREKAFEQQQELVEQQTRLNDLKIDKMESGESMMNITVDDSVEPALKLVMMNVLELMQTEFNEAADQFLLGWESVS